MYLARTDRNFPFSLVSRGSVATIGTFDGLHLGHQYLLNRVLSEAAKRNLPSIVMSFEPMPKEFFSKGKPPARLTTFREKFVALKDMGFDIFYCPHFGEEMRAIAADTFIRRLLIHAMNVRHLVVGDDFEFARNREGSLEELQRVSQILDFSVEQVASVVDEGERISSTAIRAKLSQGDLAGAQRLLGRRYRISGRLEGEESETSVNGDGFAFVDPGRRQCALSGVFAVMVHGIGDKPLGAVASIGNFDNGRNSNPRLALRFLDFSGSVSTKHVDVDFIERIDSNSDPRGGISPLRKLQGYDTDVREMLSRVGR
jgi:riboflavin kinase/FMN adenylyltransferase